MSGLAGKKILIVDDDIQTLTMLRGFFEREMNCKVKEARDGKEALRMFVSFNPEVVLLDINMPEIDGVEVLKMFKTKKPQIPVIMTTGEASLEITKKCLSEGAFTHMVKPIDFHNLSEVIGRALGLEDDWSTELNANEEDGLNVEEDLSDERLDIPDVSDEDQKFQALINILEKKGLLKKSEYYEELKRLKED